MTESKQANKPLEPTQDEPKTLSAKEQYFASLRKWTEEASAAQIQQHNIYKYFMYSFYVQLNQQNQLNQQQNQQVAQRSRPDDYVFVNDVQHRANLQRFQPIQLSVARVWKRVLADFTDKFIIAMAQLFVTYVLLVLFRLDGERGTLRATFDNDHLILRFCDILLDLYLPLLKRPGHMLLIILMLTSYECLWAHEHFSTPGKALMNIKVIFARAVLRPNGIQRQRGTIWANLYAVSSPSLVKCFKRSFFKHILLATPYGIYELIIFMLKRRATYEIVTRTLVVHIPEGGGP